MIFALWTSYYLQIKKIRAIHETVVSIFMGMFVGLIVRLIPETSIREMLNFKHTVFFNLLLPPIILNSGYELRQETFFRHFGSILVFAFLGTFISAVGLGVLVYIYSFLGLESLNFSLLECLIFGSTLSATDPVTILAIFNQLKVDPKLYSIIFGESLLNDAVSIVMYETLTHFHGRDIYISSIFHGIGIFLLTFGVSMTLGVAFGLFMSLTLKHSHLSSYPQIETCLVALVAYTSYFFSNGLEMSGIVSLLFTGITLKHYAYHTMSRRTQRATKYIFATLAQFSENFIFVYLGLSLFTSAPTDRVGSYFKPLFIIIATVSVVFTRYAAVFPLSELINLFQRHVRKQRTEELPHSYQMMLFWAGLRGAVGVALASGFQGPNAQVLRMTVLSVVVVTVVIFGGTTARMLEVLGIKIGVDEGAGSDSDDEDRLYRSRYSYDAPYVDEEEGHYNGHARYRNDCRRSAKPAGSYPPSSNPGPSHLFASTSFDGYESDAGEVLPMAAHSPRQSDAPVPDGNHGQGLGLMGEDGKWFQALDERYLLPLFSNATASRTHQARKARRQASMSHPGSGNNSNYHSADEEDDDGDLGTSHANASDGTGRPPMARSMSDLLGHIRRGVGSSPGPKREEDEPHPPSHQPPSRGGESRNESEHHVG